MGIFELRLPDIGEGIAEAELVSWLVGPGERVRVDQPVAEVMTDKATIELPSPVDGTVTWLGVEEGHRVAVGAPVARFEVDGAEVGTPKPSSPDTGVEQDHPPAAASRATAASTEAPEAPEPPAATPAPAGPASRAEVSSPPGGPAAPEAPPSRRRATAFVTGASGRPLAAPSVRRRATEAGVDLRQVRGSGPSGRIEHRDIDLFLDGATPTAPVGPAGTPDTSVSEVAVTGIRRVIAEHTGEAARRIPHFTYAEEIDVTELERLREHMNGRRPEGTRKLTPLPFVVRALVVAIADHPEINARFDDEEMIVHRSGGVHVGIAVQTQGGLVVPVVRHAEARDVWDCADEIHRLSTAAREGTVDRSELSGSTITVTSLGALGGIVTTPIINRPEVAIVGINKMQVRPVWDGSSFRPRTVMNLSSSFDHRIVDGWDAAMFVSRLKELIEQPALMFIRGS